MRARIAKLSFIFGAVLNALLLVLILLILQISNGAIFPSIDVSGIGGPYPMFALVTFAVMLLSYLRGRIACSRKKKGNKNDEPKNAMDVFFKIYYYSWPVATVIVTAFCFIFLNSYHVSEALTVFSINLGITAALWLGTVIFCAMLWAVVCAWKTTKATGVILAIIAVIISVTLLGVVILLHVEVAKKYGDLYYINIKEYYKSEYAKADEGPTAESETQTPEETQGESGAEEIIDDTESDMSRAFRYMKYKLGFGKYANSTNELIWSWRWYTGWCNEGEECGDRYYDHLKPYFSGQKDYQNAQNDFYSYFRRSRKNSDALLSIANYYSRNIAGSERNILSSGIKGCIDILLWAYNDIYSKDNSDTVLREIYNIMERYDGDRYYYCDDTYDYCNSSLRPYISDAVILKISKTYNVNDATRSSMAVWAYSFWARRHHDKVDKTAFRILKMTEQMHDKQN